MFEPISKTKRTFLLVMFCLLFLALIPLVLFHSLGYKFGQDGNLISTGGLYLNLEDRDLEVYIDGAKERQQGFLSNGLFVSELKPKVYSIEVKKAGHTTWRKQIEVVAPNVAEVSPFVLLDPATTTEITATVINPETKKVSDNPSFKNVVNLFKLATTTPALVSATSTQKGVTTTPRIKNGLIVSGRTELFIEGKNVVAMWTGSISGAPFYFCNFSAGVTCKREIKIPSSLNIRQIGFHPTRNDLVLIADSKKLYVTELDRRDPQNSITVFEGDGIEFRVSEAGELFVKHKNRYYLVSMQEK